MTYTNANNQTHNTKNVFFNYIHRYVKEIQLVDSVKRPIRVLRLSHPFAEIRLSTQVALRPEAIRFCGMYAETWDICLN